MNVGSKECIQIDIIGFGNATDENFLNLNFFEIDIDVVFDIDEVGQIQLVTGEHDIFLLEGHECAEMAESLSGMTVLLHHAEETANEEQTPALRGLAVHNRHVGSVRMHP